MKDKEAILAALSKIDNGSDSSESSGSLEKSNS
jgi:hypothetical protein